MSISGNRFCLWEETHKIYYSIIKNTPITNYTTLIIATIKNRFKEVEVLMTIERRSRYIILPCYRHVAIVAQFLVDNKLKTSLQKWICTVSNFTNLIQFHLICQMLAKFSGVEYKRTISRFRKRNRNICVVFTYSIKRACEIRKFHGAVTQQWLRNVQKSLMPCKVVVLLINTL